MEIRWKYTRNRSVELRGGKGDGSTWSDGNAMLGLWRVIPFDLQVFCNNRAMVTFCSGRLGRRSAFRNMKGMGLVHNGDDLENIT